MFRTDLTLMPMRFAMVVKFRRVFRLSMQRNLLMLADVTAVALRPDPDLRFVLPASLKRLTFAKTIDLVNPIWSAIFDAFQPIRQSPSIIVCFIASGSLLGSSVTRLSFSNRLRLALSVTFLGIF